MGEAVVTASSPLGDALHRLEGAIGLIERAVDRRVEERHDVASIESDLHRLGTDRSRLAQALDAAEARAAGLEEVNREVSRRLIAVMESIRAVLDRADAA